MARNGKIAHLPRDLREELTRRMQDAEPGGSLLAWLNAQPAVQAVLAREFGGVAVSKQNLCEWRSGGFAEWQARQETLAQARELAADATELAAATDGRLTDHLATVLAARYASALAGWHGEVTEEFRRRLRALRGLCQDIVELRRGDHSGARLKMEQERLERERERTEEEVVAQFQRWAEHPQVRDLVCQAWLSPEERRRRIREFYGRPPEPPASPPEPAPAAPESNRVKPSQTKSGPEVSLDPNPAPLVTMNPPGGPDQPGGLFGRAAREFPVESKQPVQ